jgi:hypothetical protein
MNSSTLPDAAPDGFIPVLDAVQPDLPASLFQGTTETGDGWQIEVTFTFDGGVEFEVMPSFGDYSKGGLTPSQAVEAGSALAKLGVKYGGA